MKVFRFTLIFGIVIVALSTLGWGAGIVRASVTGGTVATCDDAHLASALSGGGLVTFSCGPATLTVTSNKTIAANTTIDGGGNITLTATSGTELFDINSGVGLTLTNLTIVNLNSTWPIYSSAGGQLTISNSQFYSNTSGVIHSLGPVTITQSIFSGTVSSEAVYVGMGQPLLVSNSQFTNNEAGAISSQGAVVIDQSQFTNNTAQGNNGAIYMRYNFGLPLTAPITITNSSFVGNTGGAFVSQGGSIYINGTNFLSNTTILNANGPALVVQNSSPSDVVQILNSTFQGNNGGSISANAMHITFDIVNTHFVNNVGGDGAMDVPANTAVTITKSSFVGNTTPNNNWPGALTLSVPAWISGTTFINNSGPQGGAFYMNGSGKAVYITNTLFLSNTSTTYDGGAIRAYSGDLNLSGVTMSGNRTLGGSYFYGGGVWAGDPNSVVNIDHSLFYNNTTSPFGQGGAMYLYGPASIVNSTIYSNTAYRGGGIYAANSVTLTNVTVISNTSTDVVGGGALQVTGLTPGVMVNTILVGGSPKNCSGNPTSLGYNISSDASCTLTGTKDLSSTNPLLGPFANNGGPTYSFMPLASSPAVNAGSNADCPPDDQRGFARPIGSTCDIGAVESPYTLTVQTITFNPLPAKVLTDPPFTIAATASSGLSVTFASLTPSVCSVSGNLVTLLHTGTCTIRASQAGNATYSAAPNVDRSFLVTGWSLYLPLIIRS